MKSRTIYNLKNITTISVVDKWRTTPPQYVLDIMSKGEPISDNIIKEGEFFYLKPKTTLYFAGGSYREKYFDTFEEASDYADKIKKLADMTSVIEEENK